MNLYPFGKAVTYLIARLRFRMRYEGLENIPADGGFILACNHITMWDPLFVAHKMPRQIHYMAKIELFKNPLLGWLMRSFGAFPVDRGKGDTSSLDEAKRRLDAGGVFGIFIEGHRSQDGKPQRPRSGVAMVAGRTGADVLPCAVIYDKKTGFRGPVTVRYGQVIKNERLAIDLTTPSTLRLAAKTVMDDIVGLFDAGQTGEGKSLAG